MRQKDDMKYSEYKEDVVECMKRVGLPGWEVKNVSGWLMSEQRNRDALNGVSAALLYMAIGVYELEHFSIEKNILLGISYFIPQIENGTFSEELSSNELEELTKDCEYIRSKIELVDSKKIKVSYS